jgi:hypothetical protein
MPGAFLLGRKITLCDASTIEPLQITRQARTVASYFVPAETANTDWGQCSNLRNELDRLSPLGRGQEFPFVPKAAIQRSLLVVFAFSRLLVMRRVRAAGKMVPSISSARCASSVARPPRGYLEDRRQRLGTTDLHGAPSGRPDAGPAR